MAIEYRFANNQLDQLPSLAADLVRRKVAAIVSNGVAVQAAEDATTTSSIVEMYKNQEVVNKESGGKGVDDEFEY